MSSGSRFLDHPTDKSLIIIEEYGDEFPCCTIIVKCSNDYAAMMKEAQLLRGEWMMAKELHPLSLQPWLDELHDTIIHHLESRLLAKPLH